jgi:hypothetical protein
MARKCIECHRIITGSIVDHYRDYHFGTYLKNGEDKIRKFPDAFAPASGSADYPRSSRPISSTPKAPTVRTVDPEVERHRQANVKRLANLLDDYDIKFPNRGDYYFSCECCRKQYSHGIRLKKTKDTYIDLCNECHRLIRAQYRQDNPRKIKLEYYPQNGLNKYSK